MKERIHIVRKGKVAKKLIKEYIKTRIPIETRYNCTYDKEDILTPLLGAIAFKEFLESYTEDLREEGKTVPTADQIFNRLNTLSLNDVINCWRESNTLILQNTKLEGAFDSPLDVAIDTHDNAWFGEDLSHAVGTNQIRGTNYAHRYASIEIVENKKRLTLDAVPVDQFSDKSKVLEALITNAMAWVKIRRAYLDRGYFNVESIKLLRDSNVPFVIQAVKNPKINRMINEARSLSKVVPKSSSTVYITDYTMGTKKRSVTFKLVFLFTPARTPDEKEDIFIFATNIDVNPNNVIELAESYRKRWGIETGYRVKEEVRGKTCSVNYVVRVLFQMLSILLYNLWVLCNIILSKQFITKGYVVTMRKLRKILWRVCSNQSFP